MCLKYKIEKYVRHIKFVNAMLLVNASTKTSPDSVNNLFKKRLLEPVACVRVQDVTTQPSRHRQKFTPMYA